MATMTRQHFQFIADALKEARGDILDDTQSDKLAQHFASRLHRTNTGFKPSRFLRACGASDE